MDEWPASDRSLWLAACQPVGFLEAARPAAAWAPTTRRRVERGYGRFLGWLAREAKLEVQAYPAARWTRSNLEQFIAHLRTTNAPRSVTTVLDALVMFSQAVGLSADVTFLRAVQSRLRHDLGGTRDKAQRLRHVLDLLELGASLMRGAPEAHARLSHAVRFRDGLIISFLAMRPLRVRNFLGLEIGRQLAQQDGRWWIVIPASETKNCRPIEVRFPSALVEQLERYILKVRPMLMQGVTPIVAGDRLWLGTNGRPLSPHRLHACVCERTSVAFGLSIYPHLFRDAVATTIALDDPEHVRVAGQVLGHAFAITERHYRLSRGAEATRAHHDVLEALLREDT